MINPLIVLHTTGDDVIPFWQATLYMNKLRSARNVTLISVNAYGHCAFSSFDLLGAFNQLVLQATSVRPQVILGGLRDAGFADTTRTVALGIFSEYVASVYPERSEGSPVVPQ